MYAIRLKTRYLWISAVGAFLIFPLGPDPGFSIKCCLFPFLSLSLSHPFVSWHYCTKSVNNPSICVGDSAAAGVQGVPTPLPLPSLQLPTTLLLSSPHPPPALVWLYLYWHVYRVIWALFPELSGAAIGRLDVALWHIWVMHFISTVDSWSWFSQCCHRN